MLASGARQVPLLLAGVFLFAVADAALGVGALLPGETAIVLVAVALSGDPFAVACAVAAAAAGAFAGDHIGFAVGRALGPRLGSTRLVTRLGRHRWDEAREFVSQRFWAIIVGRLLPGVRTFIAAAAGASPMTYPRFALASAVAAGLWATLWVLGGALLGNAVLELVDRHTIPAVVLVAGGLVCALLVRRQARTRR